jgi:hypothetical protein
MEYIHPMQVAISSFRLLLVMIFLGREGAAFPWPRRRPSRGPFTVGLL